MSVSKSRGREYKQIEEWQKARHLEEVTSSQSITLKPHGVPNAESLMTRDMIMELTAKKLMDLTGQVEAAAAVNLVKLEVPQQSMRDCINTFRPMLQELPGDPCL